VRLANTAFARVITQSPLRARMTRYTLGSIVAAATSAVVFAALYVMGVGTTACSIVAFIAGAIPNWILNRRWAWQQTGRPPAKQVITYVMVSALVLLSTSWATGVTNTWVNHHHVDNHHGLRLLIVTAAYVVVTVVLFFAKFAIYEFWVFSDRSRVRAALRSLMNVSKMTRPNRIP
jgi:putative flippase GtrA